MINQALQFTCDTLDQFLRNRFGLDDKTVLLNNLIESNGSIPQANQNKIVISLINIEKETLKAFYSRSQQLKGGSYQDINPSERYNLILLLSSNFDNYNETLRFLNEVIVFFQVNNVLDAAAYSTIPPGLQKLEFEVEKITYHQMQGLWTAMGAKYQPSVIYKMRLVTIQGAQPEGFIQPVSSTANSAAQR